MLRYASQVPFLNQRHANRLWMAMDRNPIYEPLHQDPRYQALALSMETRLHKQAELVVAMRGRGELPVRPAKRAGATN